MALPHLHGTGSGQIGYGANIDTNDTPGYLGGRLIGFGEEGTSAIANRAHWALSENDNYLYGRISRDLAVPSGLSFTSSGQNNFHMTGSVFCGDASGHYPGTPGVYDADYAEGMLVLFGVFDDQFNELTDLTGNEVRVAVVRDTTNAIDKYKSGFVTDPWITFRTVDPHTGVEVQNPYTIPVSQKVRIVHAVRGDLETMDTDALIRFHINSADEVPAGVVLQDGTRKMNADFDLNNHALQNVNGASITGDIDMQAHQLLHASNITGPAGSNLLPLVSTGAMSFKDAYLTSPIGLSETGFTKAGTSTSIVGALEARRESALGWLQNHCLDKSGTITFAEDVITVPATQVVLNGEKKTVAGTVPTYTDLGTRCVVVDATGALAEKTQASLLATDVLLALYQHNESPFPGFSSTLDARWPMSRRGANMVFYCGDKLGADFSDVSTASALINNLIGVALSGVTRYAIHIVGTAQLSTSCRIAEISGDGWDRSIIEVPASAHQSLTAFLGWNNTGLNIHDVQIKWVGSEVQNSSYACIDTQVGSGSTFMLTVERVRFTVTGGGCWYNLIQGVVTNAAVRFNIVEATAVGHSCVKLIYTTGGGGNTNYSMAVVEHNVFRDPHAGSPSTCVDLPVGRVLHNVFEGFTTAWNTGVAMGAGEVHWNVYYTPSGHGSTGFFTNVATATGWMALSIRGNQSYTDGPHVTIGPSPSYSPVVIEGNYFLGIQDSALSYYVKATNVECIAVQHNRFQADYYAINRYAVQFITCSCVTVSGNTFYGDHPGYIWANACTTTSITGNFFYRAQAPDLPAIFVDWGHANISGNRFQYGNTGRMPVISVGGSANIEGNHIGSSGGSVSVSVSIDAPSGSDQRIVNNFMSGGAHCISLRGIDGGDHAVISGNILTGCSLQEDIGGTNYYTGRMILVDGVKGVAISGNTFRDSYGQGIQLVNSTACTITGNTFNSVRGGWTRNNGGSPDKNQRAVILIDSNSYQNVVSNNTLTSCGGSETDGTYFGIYNRATKAVIKGNIISTMVGLAYGSLMGICTEDGDAIVVGNSVEQSVTSINNATGNYGGINVNGDYSVVSGNSVICNGAVTALNVVWVLAVNGTHCVVSGNLVRGQVTGTATQLRAVNIVGTGTSVTGNLVERDPVFINAGMVAGNHRWTSGAAWAISADYPSATAYNANASNPLADFNRDG